MEPCAFKIVHAYGNRSAIYTHALMALASLQTPAFDMLPDATQANVDAQPGCTSVTVIRCDMDDWLTERYMNMVFGNARRASAMNRAHLTGIDALERHVVGVNGSTPTCLSSKRFHARFATSLGLAITVPAAHWRLVFSAHTRVEDKLRAVFGGNLTVEKHESANLGYAPVTRVSGSFPWRGHRPRSCRLPPPFLSSQVAAALRVASLITFEDACRSNAWVRRRYGKLCGSTRAAQTRGEPKPATV